MNCEKFESTLNELLDERKELAGNSDLHSHAENCSECRQSFEYYAAFATMGSEPVSPSRDFERSARQQNISRKLTYGAVATMAAVLLLFLSPIGSAWIYPSGGSVSAKANFTSPINGSKDVDRNEIDPGSQLDSEFWQNPNIANIVTMRNLNFPMPKTPNLEDVGQSINSVWESIREDEYLLPLIQQSALFWVR